MTALFESFSLTITLDVFSLSIPTLLHSSRVRKPVLDIDLFVTFDHRSSPILGFNHIPDTSWTFAPHYPSYGSHKLSADPPRGHILHYTRGNARHSSHLHGQREC